MQNHEELRGFGECADGESLKSGLEADGGGYVWRSCEMGRDEGVFDEESTDV